MSRRLMSLSGRRPVSSRCLQLESLEDRSMLSLPTVVAIDAPVVQVAASPESQNLGVGGSSVPAETALMAPLPKTSFTLIGPVEQPLTDASLTASLPSVDPTLADAVMATDGVEANALTSIVGPCHSDPDNNLPPEVTTFWCFENFGAWTLSGSVSDPDDSLVGRTVTFGGVLASFNLTATVDANNNFSITQTLEGLEFGFARATITDPHGASGFMDTIIGMS